MAVGHVLETVDGGSEVAAAGVPLAVGDGLIHHILPAVDDLMGVGHQLNLVGSGLQHVAPRAVLVIGGHIVHCEGEGEGLTVPRLEQPGLAEGGQHHVGFLNAAHGVGGGEVHLSHVLARRVPGIRDLHLHGDGALVHGEVLNRLFKSGVAQPVAEGVLDGLFIGRFIAFARGVVDEAGLIEAVAHVDALHVLYVVALIQVAVGKVARVPVGGGGGVVVGVGVGEPPGGIHRPRQHLAHRVHAPAAGAADPQSGVHAVLQEAQLHGVGGVDQYDDLAKALGLDQFQQILLVLGELQVAAVPPGLAVACRFHIHGQVAALAADTGEHHHRRVGEGFGVCQQGITVFVRRHLGGGEVGAGKPGLIPPLHAGVFVEVHQLLVNLQSGVGEALHQVYVGRRVTGATARAAVEGGHGGVAE